MRVRYRPSKANALLGTVGGAIMVGIGLFVVIPTFGTFGVFWTVMAVAITGYNAYLAFGPDASAAEVYVDEGEFNDDYAQLLPRSRGNEIEDRLQKLEQLRGRGVITDEEYTETRRDILRDL